MARTAGLSAWETYFKGKGDFDTLLKRDVMLKPINARGTSIAASKGEPVLFLGSLVKTKQDYLSYAAVKKGQAISPKINAWVPVKYKNKQYLCDMDSLAKSNEGGNVDLSLQTSNLLEKAPVKKLDYFGYEDVDSAVFARAQDLAASASAYIKTNRLLNGYPTLKHSLVKYLASGNYSTIKWTGPITDFELAQFAKYIGEVCIGLVLLSGDTGVIRGQSPFVGKKIKRMIYPTSQSFKGADSIVDLGEGKMIPISSKADVGAAASFFGNLFAQVMDNQKFRPTNTPLKRLYDSAIAVGINNEQGLKTGAKKIVYEYGVRNILNMDSRMVPDTYKVFQEFKRYDKMTQYSPDVRKVYIALERKMKQVGDTLAVSKLDESTTVFFCKMIAEEMNNSPKTLEILTRILGEKEYYQINLSKAKLKSGDLEFSITKSGGGTLIITGGKSSYNNIDASQGTLNYFIK